LDNIDALEVGLCSVQLGAGRQKVTDQIDPSAGIIFHVQRGEKVQKGEPVFSIYTNKKSMLDNIFNRMEKAVHISATEINTSPIILDFLDKKDLD